MTVPRLSYSAAGGIDSEDCVGCEGPSLNHWSVVQVRRQALTSTSRICERPPINHTCKHVGRDVHQIPLFSMTVDPVIAGRIHISPVGRSFLPEPRLGRPQVGVRRLECWDLRQSVASRRGFTRVCVSTTGSYNRGHTSIPSSTDCPFASNSIPGDVI